MRSLPRHLNLVGVDGGLDGGRVCGRSGLLAIPDMVVVVELLALAFISVSPPQLGLEGVVFLRQVLLSEVLGVVATAVAPLKHVGSGDVGVLEIVLGVVMPVGAGFGQIQGALRVGIGSSHCNDSK